MPAGAPSQGMCSEHSASASLEVSGSPTHPSKAHTLVAFQINLIKYPADAREEILVLSHSFRSSVHC